MLLHVGLGSVRSLSILRDSLAEIPGHGTQKINAAYALGGTALMIETVEEFLGNGLKINHLIEVNFENFPEFIDALGGIDIKLENCVRSNGFAGTAAQPQEGRAPPDGDEALGSRACARTRATPRRTTATARRRQQERVLGDPRPGCSRPATFFRLPWVSWQRPADDPDRPQGPRPGGALQRPDHRRLGQHARAEALGLGCGSAEPGRLRRGEGEGGRRAARALAASRPSSTSRSSRTPSSTTRRRSPRRTSPESEELESDPESEALDDSDDPDDPAALFFLP